MNTKAICTMVVMGTMVAGCADRGARTTAQAHPVEATPVAVTAAPAATPAPAPPAAVATKTEKVHAPAKAQPKAAAIRIKRLVVATGVSQREPEGVAKIFRQSEIDKLYAFVEVENKTHEPAEITVTFEPPQGDSEHGNVKLAVGGHPRWRTWAYTRTAKQVGSWTAVVKDEQGRTLARTPFEIAL